MMKQENFWINMASHLKKVFRPDSGVGSEFQILGITAYTCGLKPGSALILNQKSGLTIAASETFIAKWIFDNEDDLFQTVVEYYDMTFDSDIALEISNFVSLLVNFL